MPFTASPGRQLPPDGEPSKPEDRQRQRLILALILFVTAIGVVVFKVSTSGNTPEPEIETAAPATAPAPAAPTNPATAETQTPQTAATHEEAQPVANGKPEKPEKPRAIHMPEKIPAAPADAVPAPTVARKVLPPLNVEVYAGGRPVPLGSNPTVAVHVDTSNGVRGRAATPGGETSAAATAATDAGRVRISAEALQVLSHPVDPNYPLLAREMKVQGSVILDAYISRDGSIQALKIVSGPTILATAAMEAVRQWRFKPYLQAGQPVETEARITVNFTISTT